MKTLIPLILAICFVTVTGQTPNPTPKPDPLQETIRILTEQVQKMERYNAEQKKELDYQLGLERAVREARTSQPTPRPTSYYTTEYDSLRTHYPSYRYLRSSTYYPRSYSTYYPRYYPSYLYPRRAYPRYRYYPRRYLSPVRSYRRY